MRINSRTRTAITAITAVAVVGALAGIASAAIPSANGTLVGCYAKKSGALRLTEPSKKCAKTEKRTSWNLKGQAGAPGAAGIAGAPGAKGDKGDKGDQGAKGDTGPSNGYIRVANALTPVPDTNAEILQIGNLPAGSYVFNVTGDYSDGAGGGVLDCAVKVDTATWGRSTIEVEASRRTNVAMTGAVTLDAPASLTLQCDDNNGDESLAYVRMTAIQVGSLTVA